MESKTTDRRKFIGLSTGIAAGFTGPNLLLGQAKGANSRFRVGVMGLSRGKGHIKGYGDVPNTEVAYVCDVDDNRLASGVKYTVDRNGNEPKGVTDFRKILEDPDIDAISIAAPNFWHAPATILACKAGKHVYVEKPGSYNPDEAQTMVQVAKDNQKHVQMGTQRRSYPALIEAVQKLREGVIGDLRSARCVYTGARPSIGKGVVESPPPELNWELWQGPVPEQPYKSNLVHYNWHWHWLYGGGEMANNGVHSLDIARWAMGVDLPNRITYNGGRYHFDDDQETPDTSSAFFDYGTAGITWENTSCHRRKPEVSKFVTVYGDGGTMEFSSANYTIYDTKGTEIAQNRDSPSDVPHFTNFADAVRDGATLNQPIADGQISSMMCHLANIAYRTNGSVDVNPETGKLINHAAGEKLWARDAYRQGWEIH
ncbi:MAG: Gfo/Idh/MocA family oxidoreductase [Verrucomicrobiales bacterium]|nr:Gfo/Idh/MocA family oxidoreductase [Verrucomicrobiales bacterium]